MNLYYSPANGRKLPNTMRGIIPSRVYRMLLPIVPWRYNPWTGDRRLAAHVTMDPLGIALERRLNQ